MGIVGNIVLHTCCATVGMACHSWFLTHYIYRKCYAKVLDINQLLLSVEQSEGSQSRLSDMYEQHDNAACDFC